MFSGKWFGNNHPPVDRCAHVWKVTKVCLCEERKCIATRLEPTFEQMICFCGSECCRSSFPLKVWLLRRGCWGLLEMDEPMFSPRGSSCRVLCVCFVAAMAELLSRQGAPSNHCEQTADCRWRPASSSGAQSLVSAFVPFFSCCICDETTLLWMYLEINLSLNETLFPSAKITFVEQMEMYIRVLFMFAWPALFLSPSTLLPSHWAVDSVQFVSVVEGYHRTRRKNCPLRAQFAMFALLKGAIDVNFFLFLFVSWAVNVPSNGR